MSAETEQFTYNNDNIAITLEYTIAGHNLVSRTEVESNPGDYTYDKRITRRNSTGLLHHNTLPAIEEYKDDILIAQIWYTNGKRTRVGGPAVKKFYPSGKIRAERWYTDGKQHRDDDLPAVIFYDENGKITTQEWRINGDLHRDGDRPAAIYPTMEIYCKHGKQYTPEIISVDEILRKTEELLNMVAKYNAATNAATNAN